MDKINLPVVIAGQTYICSDGILRYVSKIRKCGGVRRIDCFKVIDGKVAMISEPTMDLSAFETLANIQPREKDEAETGSVNARRSSKHAPDRVYRISAPNSKQEEQ